MAGRRRATRDTARAAVFAVLLIVTAATGVGVVVFAAADDGPTAALAPSSAPWSGGAAPAATEAPESSESPLPRPEAGPGSGSRGQGRTGAGRAEVGGTPYVALGDSYAAGQGGGDYGPPDEDGECRRSGAGYPALLDAQPGIRLTSDLSCGGDTTSDLLDTQRDGLGPDTRLVTISIGGNDLGAIRVAAVCSLSPASADCRSMLMAAHTLLAPGGELEQRLRATFAAVRADAPNARIVVTGYPNLFEGPGTGDDSDFLIATLRGATESLNADIEAAVVAERRSGSDIVYADVTEAFAGHGVGSAEPWIHSSGPDMFHPTPEGYVAYAAAILGALPCDSAGVPAQDGAGTDRACF